MPKFRYKFIKDGQEIKETKEFLDKNNLYDYIRSVDGSIVSIEEIKSEQSFFKFSIKRKKIKPQEIVTFAKNLSSMLSAGISVSRALTVLGRQSKNKNFSEIFQKLNDSVNSGETLAQALSYYPDTFPDLFVSMVKAGEESGKLSYSLSVVAEQMEKSQNLSSKVKGAMIYPAVIVSVMLVIGVLLMVYMVPMLTETFRGLNIQLPLPTRIIISISDFLRSNILIFLAVVFALIFGATSWLKTKSGKNSFDYFVLHLPVIKEMSKEINAARTARTLASLISSGVSIVNAINITKDVIQNHYFKEILVLASKNVEMGEQLSVTLDNKNGDLYPVFVSEMLSVGEETGKIVEMLENIAGYYENAVDQKTKDLSTIIEPFLMILIGIVVGVFAIAMMLPTYSLVDAIQ